MVAAVLFVVWRDGFRTVCMSGQSCTTELHLQAQAWAHMQSLGHHLKSGWHWAGVHKVSDLKVLWVWPFEIRNSHSIVNWLLETESEAVCLLSSRQQMAPGWGRQQGTEDVFHPLLSVRDDFSGTPPPNNKIYDAQISSTKQNQFLIESAHTLLWALSHPLIMSKSLEYWGSNILILISVGLSLALKSHPLPSSVRHHILINRLKPSGYIN